MILVLQYYVTTFVLILKKLYILISYTKDFVKKDKEG